MVFRRRQSIRKKLSAKTKSSSLYDFCVRSVHTQLYEHGINKKTDSIIVISVIRCKSDSNISDFTAPIDNKYLYKTEYYGHRESEIICDMNKNNDISEPSNHQNDIETQERINSKNTLNNNKPANYRNFLTQIFSNRCETQQNSCIEMMNRHSNFTQMSSNGLVMGKCCSKCKERVMVPPAGPSDNNCLEDLAQIRSLIKSEARVNSHNIEDILCELNRLRKEIKELKQMLSVYADLTNSPRDQLLSKCFDTGDFNRNKKEERDR